MLTLNEAAAYVGMSPEDLMLSRMRGLPPGNLGKARDGSVYFDKADLLPARPLSRKAQLQAEAEALDIEFTGRTTVAQLEALIADVKGVWTEEALEG